MVIFILFTQKSNNMMNGIKKPSMQIGKFKDFITSDKAVTSAAAILVTPAVLGIVDRVIEKYPKFGNNATIALIVASIIIFIIAGFFSGIIQDVVLGAAIGVFINALLSIPAISNTVSRISKKTSSG